MSVLFVTVTAWLCYFTVIALMPKSRSLGPIMVVAFFVCQVSVFTQAFLTMTELLAACLLMLGLWCLQRRRMMCAFLAIGLLPLARMETCLIVGWLFAVLATSRLRRAGLTGRNILQTLRLCVVGTAPVLLWWLCGWFLTREPCWIPTGYVRLRAFDWDGLLCVNALTGLPAVLSAPQLVLFFLGVVRLPVLLKGREDGCDKHTWLMILYGTLLLHLLFLSAFVVYPKESGFGDHAAGALNPRNYNSIAPVLAIFIYGRDDIET
jgi:hypothetical protein